MKIGVVASSFLPHIGGAEFVVHNLAVEWSKQGHNVCVFNHVTDEATQGKGIYKARRYRLLRGSTRFGYHRYPFGWYARRNLQKLLDEFEPDFISAHFAYPTGYWLSCLEPLPKYVVTCHGGDITLFDWGFRKRYNCDRQVLQALNSSIAPIAISTCARRFMEDMGVESSHILDITNGVDTGRFRTKVSVDIREKLGIDKSSVLILSVGRKHPQKAYEVGIKAFAEMEAQLPDVRYLILGRGVTEHKDLAEQLGVKDKVILCEGLYDEQLVAAYQQADIFFSPSRWEMLALVVLEGMAAGLPQVVTNISGSQDAIVNNENGFVVEPEDYRAMAEALYKLTTDKSLREKFGRENVSKSEAYSWDNISRRYIDAGMQRMKKAK